MNHDAERSSNVVMEQTLSAEGFARWTSSRTRRAVDRDDEERILRVQKGRVDERRKRPDSPGKRFLGRLSRITHRVIDEGRIVLQTLMPSPGSPTSLERAFLEVFEEIAHNARRPLRIVVTGQPKTLGSAIEEHVCKIQREALVNAIRHSDATNIEAEVEYLPRRLRVVIRDNGCGFEPKVLKLGHRSHCGIRTMVEQAKAMGAQLQIWSRPGCGTEVELSFSFDPREMAA